MKFLILMNYGGGTHASASFALAHELKLKGHQVDILDVDRMSIGSVGLLTTAMYGPLIRYSPKSFEQLCKLTEGNVSTKLLSEVITTFIRPKFIAYFRKHKYDCIITTNPFYVSSVANLRRLFAPAPLGVVILDLASIHPMWFDKRLQFIITPSAIAKDVVLHAGVNPQIVAKFGIPLRPQFRGEQPSKLDARKQLGLPLDKKIILIGGNLEGAGSIANITSRLLKESENYHLVAICGKNSLLHRQLTYLANQHSNLTVYKRIDFMATLMAASDVIVTKPGPSIVTESMVMKLPIVALKTPLYLEKGNGELIERYKLGKEVKHPEDVPQAVKQILNSSYQGQPYQTANVAEEMAEYIISKALAAKSDASQFGRQSASTGHHHHTASR